MLPEDAEGVIANSVTQIKLLGWWFVKGNVDQSKLNSEMPQTLPPHQRLPHLRIKNLLLA